jgi:hypothetical protein
MMSKIFLMMILFVSAIYIANAHAGESIAALDAVKALSGVYTGHWQMYGFDKDGNLKPTLAWDDVIKVENPQIGEDNLLKQRRAFCSVTDVMTFKYPAGILDRTVKFTEGFKI